jgi:DHA3 family macrolide efflux protein-like MFS transporter
MKRFVIIWLGQFISVIGSGLTTFALAIWVYQRTATATKWTFVLFASMLPMVLLSPLAGVIVDRIGQRRSLILSAAGAGLSPLFLSIMAIAGELGVWAIYAAVAVGSAFSALQWAAYGSMVSILVPREHYARANGLIQFAQGVGFIVSPLLGALLFDWIELQYLFLIDVLSFFIAIVSLAIVRVSMPAGRNREDVSMIDLSYGWRYIAARPGLRGLLVFYAVANYVYGVACALVTPLLLSESSPGTLGRSQAIMSVGALSGGALMSVWRGPRSRIACILLFELALSAGIALAGLCPSVETITIGGFIASFSIAIIMACSQAIWQSKVAPAAQGRVFSVRYMIAWAALPLAYATAGPLADFAFDGGSGIAASSGDSPARLSQEGVRFILLFAALINAMAILWAWLNPRIRLVESEVPDSEHADMPVFETEAEAAVIE